MNKTFEGRISRQEHRIYNQVLRNIAELRGEVPVKLARQLGARIVINDRNQPIVYHQGKRIGIAAQA